MQNKNKTDEKAKKEPKAPDTNFAALVILQTYFPDLEEDYLEKALESNGGDAEKTKQ